MKKLKAILFPSLFLILSGLISAQTLSLEGEDIFAPFVSRFTAEPKGSAVLLSWKDARNLKDPVYHVYASEKPFAPESFPAATLLTTLEPGTEQYLYEPKDGKERYYLVLAEENKKVFTVFIPYRNMSMTAVAAVLSEVEQERATLLSNLKVVPDLHQMAITGRSSSPERRVILFRSTVPPVKREDLLRAARVTILTGQDLNWKDQVVPGIPFYYALVDHDLFEAGSTEILYEGSVTQDSVTIPLEEWNPQEAHSFQFSSRHIPLPVLNITSDIESGAPLPGPALPDTAVELNYDTALQLAELNFGKSVRTAEWMETEILPVDAGETNNSRMNGIPGLLEDRDWDTLVSRIGRELETGGDEELLARLHYYRGQAYYFKNSLEYAFMDFLSARDLYYTDANRWIYNIFELKELNSRKERVEF